MAASDGIWRFNAEHVWVQTCSMYQESYLASVAPNDFARQHHTRACLFFAVAAAETFLNQTMRKRLEREGAHESAILKRLRHTNLEKKIKEWPSELTNGTAVLAPEFWQTIEYYKDLRNEATHTKGRDHSLYVEIDACHTAPLVTAIVEAMVSVITAGGEPFQYWLLGWNYVGLNGQQDYPCLINNQQFRHSLSAMGFDVPAWDYGRANQWERQFMCSLEGFKALKRMLSMFGGNIEPFFDAFPFRPRLTNRWWDRRLLLGRDPGPEVPRTVSGWGVARVTPWHFVGLFPDRAIAEQVAGDHGEGYLAVFGENIPGTDDFIFG